MKGRELPPKTPGLENSFVSHMISLLAKKQRENFKKICHYDPLIAFDFDGTLAPIFKNPNQVRMRAQTKRLLHRLLNKKNEVAIISGRGYSDLRHLLKGFCFSYLVGNHGSDWGREKGKKKSVHAKRLVRGWVKVLQKEFGWIPGLEIEDKAISLSVHFRNCRNPRSLSRQIERVGKSLPGVRLVGGKMIWNFVPQNAWNKGKALLHLMKLTQKKLAVYVGDDLTDEDVFCLPQAQCKLEDLASTRRGICAIRVGRRKGSGAKYSIRNQLQIDPLLKEIIDGP